MFTLKSKQDLFKVTLPKEFIPNEIVEKYSKVMHLVSNVKGKLREDKTPLDALMAVLPAGMLPN